jgi:hypothetical protein
LLETKIGICHAGYCQEARADAVVENGANCPARYL